MSDVFLGMSQCYQVPNELSEHSVIITATNESQNYEDEIQIVINQNYPLSVCHSTAYGKNQWPVVWFACVSECVLYLFLAPLK